ncbi:hypothetical protein RhiirB3_465892 [Rhizophagus irregularis]|nr:hypothetical protein RhiirB3_465892 [Rhizophagus irregularis]
MGAQSSSLNAPDYLNEISNIAIIIVIFGIILLGDLIILSIGVHNDLLTVTDRYSEMTEFPAPIVGFQLKNNFTITCHFQLFGYYDGDIPAFTINVFNSTNQTLAQDMYEVLVNNKYYSDSSPLSASVYRTNRYFLGRNYIYHVRMTRKITRTIVKSIKDDFRFPPECETLTYITAFVYLTTKNDSWYADAAAGFMLDPNSFLLEEQTEQRNKNGFIHKRVFNSTTKKTLNEKLKPKPTLLFSANPEYDNLDLKEELIGLKEFLKLYVINISWLEEDNIKTSKKDDRKTSEEDDRKTSEEDDRKTSDEHDKKTSEEDDKSFPGCGRDDSIKNLTSGKLYKVMEFINNNR